MPDFLTEAKSLREQREQLNSGITDHLNTVENRLKVDGGDMNAEEKSAYDKMINDFSAMTNRIERLEAQAKREAELKAVNRHGIADVGSAVKIGSDGDSLMPMAKARNIATDAWFLAASPSRQVRNSVGEEAREAAKLARINLRKNKGNFRLYNTHELDQLRNSMQLKWNDTNKAYNALGTLPATAGGALVPDGFVRSLEVAQLAYGGMLQAGEIMRTSTGEPLPWPTANDTSNKGRRINEAKAVTTKDPTFGAAVLYAYKYTSDEVLVSFELLRDSAFDIPGLVGGMLGERLGRAMNDDFTNGTGGEQPEGVVTAAATGKTTAAATAITFDEVMDLEYSVDPIYRANGTYMLHDSIVGEIRKLKDGDGRYLLRTSPEIGIGDTLNGYRLVRNMSMQSSLVASKTTMLFGDFSKYKIRQVGAVRVIRLTERYAENDQHAFLAFASADGKLVNAGTNPIKKLVQHA